MLARGIVSEQWRWLTERYRNTDNVLPTRSLDLLTGLAAPMLGVLQSSCACEDDALRAEMLKQLTSGAYPERALVTLLERAHRTCDAAELSRLGLATLHIHCQNELAALLERPARSREDWSIAPPGSCACALCHELARFLADASQVVLEWPLAKPKRRHVHGILDGHDLPVRHTTRRSGSPQTLVLIKTSALFEREAKERAEQQRALRWLEEHARDFRGPW